MNVSYASDPYWGEKAAQYYFKLDEALGFKDYNSVALGIKTNHDKIEIKDENGAVLYSTKLNDMSFPLLEEMQNSYKIQLDPALYSIDGNEVDYSYSFKENVGYIDKEAIQLVYNADKIQEAHYQRMIFDAQGGSFQHGYRYIVLEIKENDEFCIQSPSKQDALFVNWIQDKETGIMDAQYKETESISLYTQPKINYEIGSRIDLANGSILVKYKDGTEEIVALTTSMVSGYNLNEEGLQQVKIDYAGKQISYPIQVSDEFSLIQEEITSWIKNIDELQEEMNQQDWIDYLDKLHQTHSNLSFSTIRKLDLLYQNQVQGLSVVIKKNPVNLAVSGLYLACNSDKLFEDIWLQDTAVIQYQKGIKNENEALAQQVAQANGFSWDSSFTLKGKMNFRNLEFYLPILISIDYPTTISNHEIVNVCLIQDGNVIKLPTVQSKGRITFKTDELGEFVIYKRASVNQYIGEDPVDTLNYLNNGMNVCMIIVSLAIISLIILFSLVVWILSYKQKNKRRIK